MPVTADSCPRKSARAKRSVDGRTPLRRVLAAVSVLAVTAGVASGCAQTDEDAASIVRTTTAVAGADMAGVGRDTRTACATPIAAERSGTWQVAGATVPADPQQIVVLDTAALDAVCALGLWKQVVGAATVSGPAAQPDYLGTGIAIIPSVGGVGSPDPARIAALHPDLILGTAGAAGADALRSIAPTVLVGGADWQSRFTGYADALGRPNAAAKLLDDYRTAAHDAGAAVAANFSQASVVRFEAQGMQVQGDDSFAGRVLADAGVQRPGAQRGKSFPVGSLGSAADRAKVEGDIVYVMFDGPDGLSNGQSVMRSADWKKLSAVSDRREFAVDDAIWHGEGLTAARAILDDLKTTLNGYDGS
ncbi:ABC transporter substrate-binding protein [Nocardia stercoris]|uniref:Transporter n=1 Tax=Nocardia stercoris TaxID=2483361 RepID=A0A3M2LD57_9NOCA|nr:ABC transporter substrate-binding protein [Nocardia stercoris]RMI35402.1 transporter [Nocardia stercoris]